MKEKIIFGNSNPGSKYNSIYKNSDVKFILIRNKDLLLNLFARNSINNYHLRYLGLKDVKSHFFYFIVPLLLKIRGVRFIWTMHNYLDHYSSSRFVNVLLNYWILLFVNDCIVFHESIKTKLLFFKKKIHVTKFWGTGYKENLALLGSDQNAIDQVKEKLKQKYYEAVVVSISTAKKNDAYSTSYYFKELGALMVFIDPKGDFEYKVNRNENVLYIKSFVGLEFWNYVSSLEVSIGIIGHYNYSVATSLFTFAEFEMPMLCIDVPANNEIIELNGLGQIFNGKESFEQSILEIQKNYLLYQKKCREFIANYSNDEINELHQRLFDNNNLNCE